MVDNGMTPHLLVNMEGEGVDIPSQQGQNGKIVLNISPGAVEGLNLGNDAIAFRARFGGIASDVFVPVDALAQVSNAVFEAGAGWIGNYRNCGVPVDAVLAIYAKENGRGMVFSDQDGSPPSPSEPPSGKRPSLKIVK